jgi:hypothetical protein
MLSKKIIKKTKSDENIFLYPGKEVLSAGRKSGVSGA